MEISVSLDLESLRVLAAVVEQGSFARAAERLNKTQSAVSYQINKLEQRLGTDLFDRSAYRAELTPVGRRILEEGRRLLSQADYVANLVEQFSAGWEPQLELVVDGMLPTVPILQVLKEMAQLSIPTQIQLRVEYLGGVQQRFMQDRADLMLVLDYQPRNELCAVALSALEAVLVVKHDHPLAGRRQLKLHDLHQHVELTVHDSSYSSAYGGPQTFGGERVFYLSDFNAKHQALRMGLGFGWMPLALVAQELADGTLQEVPYQGGSRHAYSPLLVSRLNRPLGQAGRMLSDKLEKLFAQ